MPYEISYYYILLYILSIAAEDKNNAAESKCQNFFTMETLNILLDISKDCYYLRKAISLFYFHVYLDTEREMNEDEELIY